MVGGPANQPVGPSSRIRFFAVDPQGNGTMYASLYEARQAVKAGGRGWDLDKRRVTIEG